MKRHRHVWLNWLLALLLAASMSTAGCGGGQVEAAPQATEQGAGAKPEDADPPKRPLQIGKLVKRRQIAPVMSVAHADWLTRPERDAEEQPDKVVNELKIPKGATVVDLGAGVGYFTWRLAEQVGPQGRVIAVDIQPGMLDRMKKNLEERGITNVEMVLGTPEDPHLPLGQVDLVLIVDVYHELQHPEKTMEHVRRSLKRNGRVVLIEYRREDPTIPINPLHKMSVEEVRGELEPMGFRLVELLTFLPRQHIFIFQDARAARG
jgi:SAM-dependent methyltransferase